MKNRTLARLLILATFWIQTGLAGQHVGNGGSRVRSAFIKIGNEVMHYLRDINDGQAFSKKHSLALPGLQACLTEDAVSVIPGPLTDNTGSKVDAQGVPGVIRLDEDRWTKMIDAGNDIHYLVFHEMLRCAQVDDNNYVLSLELNPFPLESIHTNFGQKSDFSSDCLVLTGLSPVAQLLQLGTMADHGDANYLYLAWKEQFGVAQAAGLSFDSIANKNISDSRVKFALKKIADDLNSLTWRELSEGDTKYWVNRIETISKTKYLAGGKFLQLRDFVCGN